MHDLKLDYGTTFNKNWIHKIFRYFSETNNLFGGLKFIVGNSLKSILMIKNYFKSKDRDRSYWISLQYVKDDVFT